MDYRCFVTHIFIQQTIEVHYKYAIALEDEGKFSEAEAEFILAGKPKEAILMYTHSQNWINALRVAEIHEPNAVVEVLQAQAAQCFLDKDYPEFESLLLKAQMPETIVQKYKSSGNINKKYKKAFNYLNLNL